MVKGLKKQIFDTAFFSLCIDSNSQAQSADSLISHPSGTINVKLLTGFWQTTDSPQTIIEFIDSNFYEITLDLKDSAHPYYFLKDKENNVNTSGFYPNWPPFSCDLKLIEPGILEVSLYQIRVTTRTIRCKKIIVYE